MSSGSFERVRRPAYTGGARCWPCTVSNLLVLGIVCLVLWTVRKPLAVAAGILGAGAIWLRGYLVPYTPRFAPRLAAALPGDRFDHGEPIEPGTGRRSASADPEDDPETGSGADDGANEDERTHDPDSEPARGSLSEPDGELTGERVLETLIEAGVLEADGESVVPTDAFRERWDEEIAKLREVDDDALAEAAVAESAAEEADVVTREDRTYVTLASGSGRTIDESWLRRPTAIGQTAAARALSAMGVPDAERANAAVAMGTFLTECPDCGSEVVEGPVGGCCGPPQLGADGEPKTALTCPECRVHLHVFE